MTLLLADSERLLKYDAFILVALTMVKHVKWTFAWVSSLRSLL